MATMKQFMYRALFLLLLVFTAGTAWAADYVIVRNGNYYNGTTAGTTTFDPQTCIWTGTSGGSFTNKSGTTLTFNSNTSWTIDTSNRLYYTTTTGYSRSTYYVGYNNNNSWQRVSNTSYAATAYEVTTDMKEESCLVNINGDDMITAVGSKTYSATAQYQAAYTRYTWNNGNGSYGTAISPVSVTPTLSATGLSSGITFNSSTGVLSVTSLPTNTTTVTLTATATSNGRTGTATKTIKILGSTPSKPTISNYKEKVTITAEASTDKIYYTTDGSTPTTSSTLYTGPFTVSSTPTIKAIAVRGEVLSSVTSHTVINPTTGVSSDGTTVTLMDWEDIDNWTYYTGVSEDVDGGNYNNNYKGRLYSPGARNIIIEYRGGSVTNASAVGISYNESENTMIYYQTLEKDQTAGNYPYTVIPNPFSKRPRTTGSTGTAGFYGFGGWKIVSGGDKINGYSDDDTLPLDADITFTSSLANNDKIVLEATWVSANVVRQNTKPTFNSGTYETNFWVLNGAAGGNSTTNPFNGLDQNMTISARYPDGTSSTTTASQREISISNTFTGTVKFEWISFNTTSNINAGGRNLYIGRGVTNSNNSGNEYIYGCNTSNTNVNQVVRVESGKYQHFYHYASAPSSIVKQIVIFGCDYDRAKADNTQLNITGVCKISNNLNFRLSDSKTMLTKTYSKSGQIMSNVAVGGANTANVYYFSPDGGQQSYNGGCRYLEIQGGEWCCIAGGFDYYHKQDDPAFTFRMKGGKIRGSVYGAGEFYSASGVRVYVLTGGEINGWLAGGANGTRESGGGVLDGTTYIYVGGNARIDSKGSTAVINKSLGGNVYGAGCGYNADTTPGQVTLGTNVVMADRAYVERGVYGGGGFGYCDPSKTANVYVTGGIVNAGSGVYNGSSYDNTFVGGVFGGASMNKGGTANIYMTGGTVKHGVYGGSNMSGKLDGSTNIKVVGGFVGSSASDLGHICGGGYGSATRVTNNVDVTIGGTATVYGDVYGGSEQGLVNTNANSDTYQSGKHVNVTVNGGTINGDVYGGGLGTSSNAANTYGKTAVTVSGGEITGRVFGCNNVNGRPFDTSVTVDITGGTIHSTSEDTSMGSVYGGGNQAQYAGSPTVTLNGADAECDNIFGGGLAAQVNGDPKVQIQNGTVNKDVYGGGALAIVQGNTNVQMSGGHVKRNVYGGGLGDASTAANITRTGVNTGGNTEVLVSGGSVDQAVFGGNNVNGMPAGAISVTVTGSDTPTGDNKYTIGAVFGGGNKANYNGKPVVTISGGYVGEAFGGAREANVTNTDITVSGGTIGSVYGGGYGPVVDGTPTNAEITDATGGTNVKIRGGKITSIFGGSNQRGDIAGTIGLDINWDADKAATASINSIYGGGRNAPYPKPVADSPASKDITVALQRATANYVFGGGLGESAVVTGNTSVIINDNNAKVQQEVYGGGALGDVTADTKVILKGGSVNNVYGGGLGSSEVAAKVGGNTLIELNKPTNANNDDTYGTCVVNGSIFGANNVNGTPEGNTDVKIYKTVARTGQTAGQYDVAEVYGGGNLAAYVPTAADATTNVTVMNCNNSIEYVYGGGNAAPVPATNVTIWGAREIANVFGGGNGYGASNPGANVGYNNISNNTSNPYGAGTTQVNVYGGTVNSIFGGSNTKGLIAQSANVNVTADPQETMPDACTTCALQLNEVYGSGNEAEMFCAANMDLGCIPGVKQVYGGAKNANVGTATSPVEVTLNITSGKFEKVFGGNNLGGDIYGFITVNVDETGCFPVEIDELYGCGNQAAYDMTKIKKAGETVNGETVTYGAGVVWHDPTVNVYSASRIGSVFGGGLGTAAVVTGNPIVNIMQIPGKYNPAATASATANTTTLNNDSKLGGITGAIYGGGNLAKVIGNTTVNIANVSEATRPNGNAITNIGANIKGNVYGGGNLADVTGKTTVNVGKK